MSDRKLPTWVIGVAPLALLVLLVFTLLKTGPLGVLRGSFPPVEELTIDQILLPAPGVVEVHVVNGGPEPSTIAQVMVDDAMWIHQIDGDRTIPRLGRRTITLAYPWVEGEPHQIKLLTSTGLTFTADVAVATQSPQVDATYLTTFALWWAAWAIGVVLCAAALRAAIEAGTLMAVLVRPGQVVHVRRWLETAGLGALYLGLPLWLLVRILAT